MVICITYKIPFSLKSIKGVHYPFLESKKEGKGKESEMGGRMVRRRGIQVHFLRENKDRMDYKHMKKNGIGIESSNNKTKTVCHTRLKRSGAWWYVEKANQVGLRPTTPQACKGLCSEFRNRRTPKILEK